MCGKALEKKHPEETDLYHKLDADGDGGVDIDEVDSASIDNGTGHDSSWHWTRLISTRWVLLLLTILMNRKALALG